MSDPVDLAELANVGETAARAAGAVLTRHFGMVRDLVIDTKSSASDLVSIADRTAEGVIIDVIAARRPDDSVLGEEGGLSRRGGSGVRWIVDPLDGTANFLTGNPQWCVSLGAEHDGRRVLGVVFDPLRDELFVGANGRPMTLNHRVVARPPARPPSASIIATGFSYDAGRRQAQAEIIVNLVGVVGDLRRGGAAALDLAWTAAGRLDAYYEHDIAPWDVAAGELLCVCAGLAVIPLVATDRLPPGLLVCPDAVSDELAALLSSTAREGMGPR